MPTSRMAISQTALRGLIAPTYHSGLESGAENEPKKPGLKYWCSVVELLPRVRV